MNIKIYYKKGVSMGKLIIDGNSVFEIDEECVKRRKIPRECDVEKYLNSYDDMDSVKKRYSASKSKTK